MYTQAEHKNIPFFKSQEVKTDDIAFKKD